MILGPWKRRTKLTPAAVRMIKDGWPRARAAGWRKMEWCQDCAALFGVTKSCINHVLLGTNWRGNDHDDDDHFDSRR